MAEVIGLKPCNQAVIRVSDSYVDKRQVHIDMEGLALLNDLARCVMLHVVGDEGLRDRERGEFPDSEAKKQKRNERNEENTKRNQTTFHRVSIVLTVIALNLRDCCRFLDRIAQNSDTACSLRILQTLHRHRSRPKH